MTTFLIIIASFLLTVPVLSFLEWLVHGKFMHGIMPTDYLQELAKNLFQDQHKEHHTDYPPRDYQNSDHGSDVNLPWWVGALAVGVMSVPGSLVSYFTGHWEIEWTVAVTTALYFRAYNYVHTCFHVPNGCRWFEKTGLYRRMNRYHQVHHVRNEKWGQLINICLVCPFADWIMKTWLQPAKSNGNPVRG